MTHEEMNELCRTWLDAFARHDLPSLTPLYADTTELESPMAGHISGREAVVKASEGLFGAFPDFTMIAEPPLIDGDRVAITAESIGSVSGVVVSWASMVNVRSNTDDALHCGREFEDAAVRSA